MPLTSANLAQLGAAAVPHLAGSLLEHLEGTERVLRSWGAPEHVCRAGLFHAIYGTDGFPSMLADVGARERCQQLLGLDAERLVYLFCACDRRRYYPRLGSSEECRFPDRFSGEEYTISAEDCRALFEMVVANELDLAARTTDLHAACCGMLAPLIDRAGHLLGAACLASYRRACLTAAAP